jgi:hypothetical protein
MTAKGVQMTSKKDEIEEIRQRNEVFKREEYTGDFTSHYMASPKTSLEQVGADIDRLLEIIAAIKEAGDGSNVFGCHIYPRDGEPPLFESSPFGVFARLHGYTIMPTERYEAIIAEKDAEIARLKTCDCGAAMVTRCGGNCERDE